jgi:hypothetical protein
MQQQLGLKLEFGHDCASTLIIGNSSCNSPCDRRLRLHAQAGTGEGTSSFCLVVTSSIPKLPSLRNNKSCPATDRRSLPVGYVYKFFAYGVIGGLAHEVFIGKVSLRPLASLI